VLTELFSLGVMAKALQGVISSKSANLLQRGPVDQKFQVEWVAPTNHSFSQKTVLNVLSYGIKYGLIFLPFCHKQTDGQTDGQTVSSLDRVCIPCSAVKMKVVTTSRLTSKYTLTYFTLQICMHIYI